MKLTTAGMLGLITLLTAFTASAKDKKPSKTESQPPGSERREDNEQHGHHRARSEFSHEEQQVISSYVIERGTSPGRGKKPHGLPPGLEKKYARTGKLPPGWEKKVVKGTIMPREVYAECKPLPPELVLRLPAPPVGTVTVAVHGKVARVVAATLEILDVFDALP